jgi:hypothetical protein
VAENWRTSCGCTTAPLATRPRAATSCSAACALATASKTACSAAGFESDDIQQSRAELLSRGVTPISGVEGGPDVGSYWAYFQDAEGNLFEVVQKLGKVPE